MTPDQKADRIIAGMVSTGVATAVVPLPLGIPFMGAVAGGVVAIGACYSVSLSKDEAWKLIREFFKAAGFTFFALNVGWQFITWIMYATGAGAPVAMALDTTQCVAIAYAVGEAAKFYFSKQAFNRQLGAKLRGVEKTDTRELGAIMRKAYRSKKTETTGHGAR
jgi:hypothetical protein